MAGIAAAQCTRLVLRPPNRWVMKIFNYNVVFPCLEELAVNIPIYIDEELLRLHGCCEVLEHAYASR